MKSNTIKYKIAKTFREIFDNPAEFYEVYTCLTNGTNIKRYLVKGVKGGDRWNRHVERFYLTFHDKNGRAVYSTWTYTTKQIEVYREELDSLSFKRLIEYYDTTVYLDRNTVFNKAIEKIRRDKMKLNKKIVDLQNQLYSIE